MREQRKEHVCVWIQSETQYTANWLYLDYKPTSFTWTLKCSSLRFHLTVWYTLLLKQPWKYKNKGKKKKDSKTNSKEREAEKTAHWTHEIYIHKHTPEEKNVAGTSTREWSTAEVKRKTNKQHDLF